jgi:hypothetical protein
LDSSTCWSDDLVLTMENCPPCPVTWLLQRDDDYSA